MTSIDKNIYIKSIIGRPLIYVFLILILVNTAFSQKKLQLGAGTVLRSPNFNNINDNSLSKISLGFSVNADLKLQNHLKLKIAVESFNQTLNVALLEEKIYGISIPVLLHKSLVKSNKNWNFGVEGGCSWNIFDQIDHSFTDVFGLYNGRIQSLRSNSNFTSPNIISRIGLNAYKDLKNNSTIHFNLTYNLSLLNWDNIYVESLSPIDSNLGFYHQKIERNIIDLSHNRLQFGFYITFGKIELKKG